jgi:nucleotide sugar dehydrogenase
VNDSSAQQRTVAVVGLGKIGLPLAIQYVRAGFRVVGCDINEQVVTSVNAGVSHVLEEPGLDESVASAVAEGLLSATIDTSAGVRAADVVVIIVPVVVKGQGEIDFRALDSASAAVGAGLRPGALIIYETTLPVGTTAGRIRETLERVSQQTAGADFLLAYSPERVSSGVIFRDLKTYPKVVGGLNTRSAEAAEAFYREALGAKIIRMASCDEAEFVKLIETTYRDVNIALANEYAMFADAHGVDLAAAAAAANTQPYSHIHASGLGVGGHCIPVYPYFLMAGAAAGLDLARAARRINDGMAGYAARRLEAELGDLDGQTILLLGVTYRGDVRETAFSSARLVRDALVKRGATVVVDDPLYTAAELEDMGYAPLPESRRHAVRAVVLQSAHGIFRELDLSQFPNCQVALDGREGLTRAAVEAAGVRYIAIGDGHGHVAAAGAAGDADEGPEAWPSPLEA